MAYHALIDGQLPRPDLPIKKVCEVTGFTEQELKNLHNSGTIFLQDTPNGSVVRSEDIDILKTWATIRDLGYQAKDGFNFKHLQRYADSVSTLAETELSLFLDAYANLPTNESAEMGARGVEAANELLKLFHTRAINHALRKRVENDNL
jgi:hypothetical protein